MDDPQMLRILGRMESKIDALHEVLNKHIEDDDKVEERVRKIERKQSWFMGGLAVIGVVVGAAWKLFTDV